MHDKEGVNNAGLLVIVGHNATDERGLSAHQHVDQVVQLILEIRADSLEVGHLGCSLRLDHNPLLASPTSWGRQILLLLCLSRVVTPPLHHQRADLGFLEEIHNSVIDGISVLV